MEYSKEQVAAIYRRAGLRKLADEALRTLPDLVDLDQLQAWAWQHGISRDELISRLGGNP